MSVSAGRRRSRTSRFVTAWFVTFGAPDGDHIDTRPADTDEERVRAGRVRNREGRVVTGASEPAACGLDFCRRELATGLRRRPTSPGVPGVQRVDGVLGSHGENGEDGDSERPRSITRRLQRPRSSGTTARGRRAHDRDGGHVPDLNAGDK